MIIDSLDLSIVLSVSFLE